VNLSQRLEQLNKEFETDCLICGTTFQAARSECADAAPIGTVQVRGRRSPVEVFALGPPRGRHLADN
jgi:adenylate cyclase